MALPRRDLSKIFAKKLKTLQASALMKAAVLCSVVPRLVPLISRAVESGLGMKTLVVGKDMYVPIKNNYGQPKQVGQDRLVCAYAAKIIYGYPAIIIDLGTAITFDVVSGKGSYEGGMIVPGIRLSAESLFKKTALLPDIHIISKPKTLIGKDTETSILSGLFHGYGAMCCGLIDRLAKNIGGKPKVILTGGYAGLIASELEDRANVIDIDLVFKGMRLLFGQKIM